MDETVLFPSPNWFQPSGLAVSSDDWLVYGGPSKSLCILQPLPDEYDTVIKGQHGYTAHFVNRAHPEKIVCVDISPEWPEKKLILSGSADGAVKQWNVEQGSKSVVVKLTHSHEIHSHEKEEVAGVGYCKDGYAVTVGSYGNIVKWDLNSNVAKSFNHVLKSFKPICMACSPHQHMHVAIGTKQGVVFVLDLNGTPRIVYKVRGQDDEILKVSWCPQYEVAVRKALKESDRKSSATNRMENIRKETESPETMKRLEERVKNSKTTEQPIKINENGEPVDNSPTHTILDESGIGKTLPEDSFDDSIVPEDDMFDIYKEPEIEEFGHKKYQPVDILVKVPDESTPEDYLVECQKLKDEILKRKNEPEPSIEALVNAMEKTDIDNTVEQPSVSKPASPVEGKIIKGEVESSVHIHKHLLATIGKYGSVRVWSKSGKLVGSCAVTGGGGGGGGGGRAAGGRPRPALATSLLWQQPDVLLVADSRNQVLDLNPLKIDCKNKLEYRVLHALHKRGLFALASGAPRCVAPGDPAPTHPIWSAGQDRALIAFWPKEQRAEIHATCGGFIYTLETCPYDARRVAVSVGDGAVRVWESESLEQDGKVGPGRTTTYWQSVQGKVLTCAWHPTREGLIAFGTAESRVGLIETKSKSERPVKVLQPMVGGGVYSLSWGAGNQLLACGAGELVRYQADRPDQAPTPVAVWLEGQQWAASAVKWSARGVLLGSAAGAVAVLQPDTYDVLAAAFVFNKMIHTMDWHPLETSQGECAPTLTGLVAVCSLDRNCNVVVLDYSDKEDGGKQLTVWKTLSGHTGAVLQVFWSPHREADLLSTSHDGTVRIWDVVRGACTATLGVQGSALGAAWSPWPALPAAVLSGAADCCLRLWRAKDHPADTFTEIKHELSADKKKKKSKKEKPGEEESAETDERLVTVVDPKLKVASKKFLLPLVFKQTQPCSTLGGRALLQRLLQGGTGSGGTAAGGTAAGHGLDYIKLFGNINELNELLDNEMERHCDTGNMESWAMLGVVRGQIDAVLQQAAKTDTLDSFLLSLAPCVSFKYWKDATLLYLQQIDRLVAKGDEQKLVDRRSYGGAVYRKTAVQLSLHDVKAAVHTLCDANLFKEAYVLSRTRYMDSLAEHALRRWAQHGLAIGHHNLAAVCFIALGDLSQAAAALGKSSDEESLSFAADIAKILGQNTFAGHIEEKRELIKIKKEALKEEEKQEDLKELPSRAEILLQKIESGDSKSEESVDPKELTEKEANVLQEQTLKIDDNANAANNKTDEVEKDNNNSVTTDEMKNNKEGTIKTTDELLEMLPKKMERLLKEQNPIHRGDGDTIQNGKALEEVGKVLENMKEVNGATKVE